MAKAASPIRLQDALMKSASATAKRYHRSTAEQIEYWADIGRQTSHLLNPDKLIEVLSGISKLSITPISDISVNAESIFKQLEVDRASGLLKKQVSNNQVRYQVCESHPQYLEQINPDGSITIGQFKEGIFYSKQGNKP